MPDVSYAREVALLVKSRYALVCIETVESARAEAVLEEAAVRSAAPLFEWSLTDGMRRVGGDSKVAACATVAEALQYVCAAPPGGVYLMHGLQDHLEDLVVRQLLRDVESDRKSTVVIVAPSAQLPEELRRDAAVLRLTRPSDAQIEEHLVQRVTQLARTGARCELGEADAHRLVAALRGLTMRQIDRVFERLVAEDGVLTAADVEAAAKLKAELVASSSVVELSPTDRGLEWVAGLAGFKRWALQRQAAFAPGASEFGLEAPKGVLLAGVPGCGKSLAVKALAHQWGQPLIRLDASRLFDKYVGSTERNLREALDVAESLAPSILWIDEIEKAFSSTGPSDTDGGLAFRVVGMLATWLQERAKPVFVAATSNDITLLPPELTRQGRFDELFFVDLPDEATRAHMFSLQLARRGRDYQSFDLARLAAASDGFSGAEVEQSISNALYSAFADQRELTTEVVLAELSATRPLSQIAPEKVAGIREWGRLHARAA